MFTRNHYIQKRLLKNFAIRANNGKYKICVLDLIKFAVNYQNTESAFYENNLYDIHYGSNTKELLFCKVKWRIRLYLAPFFMFRLWLFTPQ